MNWERDAKGSRKKLHLKINTKHGDGKKMKPVALALALFGSAQAQAATSIDCSSHIAFEFRSKQSIDTVGVVFDVMAQGMRSHHYRARTQSVRPTDAGMLIDFTTLDSKDGVSEDSISARLLVQVDPATRQVGENGRLDITNPSKHPPRDLLDSYPLSLCRGTL
jgi:hypothetical protein